MLNFNKNELKIFLTFFIIYFVFITWFGHNENSSLDLNKAIVEEGRLEIDNYYNDTTDRSVYNNHYYSNKPIGTPLLAAPIYASWKFIYYNFFPQSFIDSSKPLSDYVPILYENNVEIVWYVNSGFLIKMAIILITGFTSCLFSALTVLLIYKISAFFTKNEKHKILLIIIYGLGTLAFPYATVFFFHSIATFFLFFSFYLLFNAKTTGIYQKYVIFAGLASGYALITDNLSFLTCFFLAFYILSFSRKKKLLTIFFVTNFVAIAPLLIYNYYIFNTPFESMYRYLDPAICYSQSWISTRDTGGFSLTFEPFRILRLLFFPHIGLFFYYPVLILSFFGLMKMNKKYGIERLFIFLLFVSTTVLVSMHTYWWGNAFGARFLLNVLPFLVIPIAYSFKKSNLKILSILLIFSILTNVLSTVSWNDIVAPLTKVWKCDMDSEYANKINTLEIIANPIFRKNIFDFLLTGPRSRLVESFFVKGLEFDIRETWPPIELVNEPRIFDVKLFTSPFGFVFMKVSFVTVLIIISILFLVWRRKVIKLILR
jgi:hypothetical protein